MTPTMEQVWEWARQTGLSHLTPERLEQFAALAFAAGSRSGEDARDAARWRKHMEAMRDEMSCLLIRMFEGTAEDYEAAIDAAMGAPDAKS